MVIQPIQPTANTEVEEAKAAVAQAQARLVAATNRATVREKYRLLQNGSESDLLEVLREGELYQLPASELDNNRRLLENGRILGDARELKNIGTAGGLRIHRQGKG